ncbi:MAG: hypothetical protein AABX11_07810 [Nanoarchaeota archaeon]
MVNSIFKKSVAYLALAGVLLYGMNHVANAPQRTLREWYTQPCRIQNCNTTLGNKLSALDNLAEDIGDYETDPRDMGFILTDEELKLAISNVNAHRRNLDKEMLSFGNPPSNLPCCDKYSQSKNKSVYSGLH